jgi:hypothetical protein
MHRTYQYRGFSIEVSVETDFNRRPTIAVASHVGYVATVRILRSDLPVAVFSPLRFGETQSFVFFGGRCPDGRLQRRAAIG